MSVTDNFKAVWNRFVASFLSLPTTYWERLFIGVLIIYFVYIIAETLTLPGFDRRFPLFVGVGSLLLLLIIFSSIQFTAVGRFMKRFEGVDLMGGKAIQEQLGSVGGVDLSIEEQRRRSYQTLGWLIGLFVLTVVFGMLMGVFLFVMLYYRWWVRFSWRRTIGYSVLIWVFIYVAFGLVLGIRFWGGLLEYFGYQIMLPF